MNKANTPLEQIYYNTKDIEKLKEIVKPLYNCNADLGDTATNVLRENTNYPEGAEFGFLIDYNGHLYKINGVNTDQTQLYIEFYATLKGADGADAIDDDVVSTFKCWSSDKTLEEINKTRDKGVYITSTQPTFANPFYTLSTGNLDNVNSNIDIQLNDLILYIDAEDKVKELYNIVMKTGTTLELNKIGDFGGEEPKQLYQHNITLFKTSTYFVLITIINENGETMSINDLEQYLANKGLTSINHCLSCTGADMTQARPYFGVYTNEAGNTLYAIIVTSSFQQLNLSGVTYNDTVTPL